MPDNLGKHGDLLVAVLVWVARVWDKVGNVHRFIVGAMNGDSRGFFCHGFTL